MTLAASEGVGLNRLPICLGLMPASDREPGQPGQRTEYRRPVPSSPCLPVHQPASFSLVPLAVALPPSPPPPVFLSSSCTVLNMTSSNSSRAAFMVTCSGSVCTATFTVAAAAAAVAQQRGQTGQPQTSTAWRKLNKRLIALKQARPPVQGSMNKAALSLAAPCSPGGRYVWGPRPERVMIFSWKASESSVNFCSHSNAHPGRRTPRQPPSATHVMRSAVAPSTHGGWLSARFCAAVCC